MDIEDDIMEMRAEEQAQMAEAKITLFELVTSPTLKLPLLIAIIMQLSQQLSGINAVSSIGSQGHGVILTHKFLEFGFRMKIVIRNTLCSYFCLIALLFANLLFWEMTKVKAKTKLSIRGDFSLWLSTFLTLEIFRVKTTLDTLCALSIASLDYYLASTLIKRVRNLKC